MNRKHRLTLSFNSPVILGFSLACLGALLLGAVTGGAATSLFFSVYRSSLLDPLTYVRFIGHVFGHGSWEHFFGNITMILVLGPMLEEKYGSENILLVILATAVITGVIHFILFPHTALLGASGVVFAFILLASFTDFREGTIPLTFVLVAVIYIGGQIYQAVFVQDNVSNLTHILGGGVGSVMGYLIGKQRR